MRHLKKEYCLPDEVCRKDGKPRSSLLHMCCSFLENEKDKSSYGLYILYCRFPEKYGPS